MDFIHLFLREEKIVGVSADTDAIYALSLVRKNHEHASLGTHGNVALSEATIEEGALVNVRVFGEKLRVLWKATKPLPLTTQFIIASLPSSLFHFQSFTLPGSLSGWQLREVMGTQMGFALPIPEDLMYFDWEEVPPRASAQREIFFIWARRSAIDPYLAAFRDAGCIPVAIEPHYVSILRTLDIQKNALRVFAFLEHGALSIVIYDRGGVRFVRVVPWERHPLSRSATTPEEAKSPSAERIVAITSDEIRRTLLCYQSVHEEKGAKEATYTLVPLFSLPNLVPAISDELAMEHTPPVTHPLLASLTAIAPTHRMHPVFGAGARALMARGEDTIVSIMPVGTEALYRRTRALAFTRFVHDFTIAFSWCFAILFCVMAVGFSLFIQREKTRMQTQGNFTLPAEVGAWERDAKTFNDAVAVLTNLDRERPVWSDFFRTIMTTLTPRITLMSMSADRTVPLVTITGKADTLAALLDFKKSLETAQLFTSVDLPLDVFSQEGIISFTLPLTVRDMPKLLSIIPTP